MSIQAALSFFQAVRTRPELQARIGAWGAEATTDRLTELARELGLECTREELEAAFRHDWSMRWVSRTTPR